MQKLYLFISTAKVGIYVLLIFKKCILINFNTLFFRLLISLLSMRPNVRRKKEIVLFSLAVTG